MVKKDQIVCLLFDIYIWLLIGFLGTLSTIAEFLKVHHWLPRVFTLEIYCAHVAPWQAEAGNWV